MSLVFAAIAPHGTVDVPGVPAAAVPGADDGNPFVVQFDDGGGRELEVDRARQLDLGRLELGESSGQGSGEDDCEVPFDVHVVRRQHDRRLGRCSVEAPAEPRIE